MKRKLKNAGLRTLRSAGIFSLSTRLRRTNNLVILCYHGISLRDEHKWEAGLYITPARFRERLELLRSLNTNVLPLAEALHRLHSGSLPPRSVVITFDDGFYDFYHHAWPLVREFGYPCTVYLTTWYSRFRLPIFNLVISYLLWKSGNPEPRGTAVKRYVDSAAAASLSAEEKDQIARELAESCGIDYNGILADRLFQIVSPDEAAAMARSGIDIQLHTHRHRTPLDRELFLNEIRDNARSIEEITGRIPHHFCYPSGVTMPEFLPWLRECGVESATTCETGLARRTGNPLMLPRFLDGGGVEQLDFEMWLSGLC